MSARRAFDSPIAMTCIIERTPWSGFSLLRTGGHGRGKTRAGPPVAVEGG